MQSGVWFHVRLPPPRFAPCFTPWWNAVRWRTQFLNAALATDCEVLAYGISAGRMDLLIEAGDEASLKRFLTASDRILSGSRRTACGRRMPDAAIAGATANAILRSPISGSFAWHRLAALIRSTEPGLLADGAGDTHFNGRT